MTPLWRRRLFSTISLRVWRQNVVWIKLCKQVAARALKLVRLQHVRFASTLPLYCVAVTAWRRWTDTRRWRHMTSSPSTQHSACSVITTVRNVQSSEHGELSPSETPLSWRPASVDGLAMTCVLVRSYRTVVAWYRTTTLRKLKQFWTELTGPPILEDLVQD